MDDERWRITPDLRRRAQRKSDLKSWSEPPPDAEPLEVPPDLENQLEARHELKMQFIACLEDAVKHRDVDRMWELIERAERIASGAAHLGYRTLRPMARSLSGMIQQVQRAKRRWTMRRYIRGQCGEDELAEACVVRDDCTEDFQEDVRVAEGGGLLTTDLRANGRAIIARWLLEEKVWGSA
jgi:hypothetical protein